jgi:ADP-ribose pyrophosphatase YjhB (NUDIX family)
MNQQALRRSFEPVLRRIFHLYWRLARGMTLGVRAVVLDGDNRVFLVKHSYVTGWHLPGGGVEVGETFRDALRRELAEEGCIEILGEPALHGIFLNSHVSRRDHVAVYLVRHFRQDRLPEPNREIVACGFFEAGALPAETTKGTRLRILEALEGKAPIATWR